MQAYIVTTAATSSASSLQIYVSYNSLEIKSYTRGGAKRF